MRQTVILWSRALLRPGVRTSILYIGVYTPPCKHVHTPVWCGVNFSPRPHTGVVIHAPREKGEREMRKNNKLLQSARMMPPLVHNVNKHNELDFDISKSEVVNWIIRQPEVLEYIFRQVRGNRFVEGLIEYDSETNTWKGIDYHD